MEKNVDMNEVDISSEEYPIIGTSALATCFGILLYDKVRKIAIVGHSTSDWIPVILKILNFVDDSYYCTLSYLIIPGYDSKKEDVYKTKIKIEKFFKLFKTDKIKFEPFDDEVFIIFDEETCSYEFRFDSRIGKFLSEKKDFIKK